MLLKSKVDGCAVGRSTYLAQDYHVDDEHCHWHDHSVDDYVNVIDESMSSIVKMLDDTFDDCSGQRAK